MKEMNTHFTNRLSKRERRISVANTADTQVTTTRRDTQERRDECDCTAHNAAAAEATDCTRIRTQAQPIQLSGHAFRLRFLCVLFCALHSCASHQLKSATVSIAVAVAPLRCELTILMSLTMRGDENACEKIH